MKEIEKKYRRLSDIEHVLLRPQMYVGSTKPHESFEFIKRGSKFVKEQVVYIPALLKIFDEIISNSVDESKRNPKLNEIRVTVDLDKNEISVWDNGGIPVVLHSEYGMYIPELIFSNLKAGSNFDDTQKRNVAGMNGVGSTLTNIFSKRFMVATSDGKSKFVQVYEDNMTKKSDAKVAKSKQNFTEISFIPDFERFNLERIDECHFEMIRKRVCEIAACNRNLKIKFIKIKDGKKETENIKFKSFKEFISLFVDDFVYEGDEKWEIGVSHSNEGFQQVSYVNSIETKDGGSHVEYILSQIIFDLRESIKKKHKIDVKPSDIKNHLFLFVNTEIINPQFESQTKEKLITEWKDFGSVYTVSEKTIKKLLSSEVVQSILDWYETKKKAEERKQIRTLNKSLSKRKVLSLIDAKNNNREECILGVFEGLSALSAVRKYRDPKVFGAFPLRGKFINVYDTNINKISKNQEVQDLMAAIGLELNKKPENLRYGKIYIYTDADVDGNSISALLVNFFFKFWKELFKEGRIYKVLTPIVVAKKGKKAIEFYSMNEFKEWEKSNDLKSWNIEYKKGLASLENEGYEKIIKNPEIVKITEDDMAELTLKHWFGKDSEPRKKYLLQI